MSVAKVTEIIASSDKSIEDAIESGIKRANKTINNIKSAWVDGINVEVKKGKISSYRVNMKVTFVLKG